jgi:hypothetical protein
MGTRDTYHRTVLQACALAGDEVALARLLRAPVSLVVDWILGDVSPPTDVFLRCVDILITDNQRRLETQKRRIEATKEFLAAIRRRHRSGP